MLGKYEKELHRAVAEFITYQQEVYPNMSEENDNGEWVFGDEFNDMRNAFLAVVENVSYVQATDVVIDDLLYAIARDNECCELVSETLNHPEWFAVLCQHSLQTDYTNAKWQFAEYLHEYRGNSKIGNLIFRFLETGDEYTERMALRSLSEMYPEKVEQYAFEFWNRQKYDADEYQKIMVLYVLDKVKSPLLEHYLDEADTTDYVYLKQWSKDIRDKNF